MVAVKDGTIVISDALKNSNGTYRSYGEYVVIDHHDGTMTLYAHGLPNSRKVQFRR
ncbi:MAG: M23 family metallopeptidase [Clostridia bacterium]|nr:M23 family metallopeptidase [Clostridia bacterium]